MTTLLAPEDPPALRRLAALDHRSVPSVPAQALVRRPSPATTEPGRRVRPMGYQPGLDGLRALSVLAVIAYHAGFSWMPGGFFGVEVFFVVSGFLITSLLLDERSRTGVVSLRTFWLRRARRLLPALAVVLVVVAVWALIAGSAAQTSQLRTDLPWAILYAGNWGQIAGGVPYYSADLPLLRHLWSLAVEEQWYLVWPVVFVALVATRWSRERCAAVLAAVAGTAMILTFSLHAAGPGPVRGPIAWLDGVDRVNFVYLSTPTRMSGLLLGAAAAFVWRPWSVPAAAGDPAVVRRAGLLLDVVGMVAIAGLGCVAASAVLTEGYVYQWLLAGVSMLSLLVVLVVVHPAAIGMRRILGWAPLVGIGRRSYGLYLWHWPIFVMLGATAGPVLRVAAALVVTVVVSELCYRFVELPVRRGSLAARWRDDPVRTGRMAMIVASVVAAVAFAYVNVSPFDRARGGEESSFTLDPTSSTQPAPAAGPAPAVGPPVARAAPVGVMLLGDSQARSLAVNQPAGLEQTLAINDGSMPGCSIYDHGRVYSVRQSFDNSFAMCDDWQGSWAAAVADSGSEIAAVVLGAWDVFDLDDDGRWLVFASPEWDAYFTGNLQSGIDAVVGAGARVALVEVACMRPRNVEGAAVPPLPERADDTRVAHLNALLQTVAAANASTTSFVEGPDEWCADEDIATDLAYRWDGVHTYKPGAALVYERIAPSLVDLAR